MVGPSAETGSVREKNQTLVVRNPYSERHSTLVTIHNLKIIDRNVFNQRPSCSNLPEPCLFQPSGIAGQTLNLFPPAVGPCGA